MTEREQLLTGILDDPDEDTPRLVYADWLEENGEEIRSWVIRYQCCPGNSVIHASWKNLPQYSDQIRSVVLELPHAAWEDCEITRGFISSVSLTCADFLQHAAALEVARSQSSPSLRPEPMMPHDNRET